MLLLLASPGTVDHADFTSLRGFVHQMLRQLSLPPSVVPLSHCSLWASTQVVSFPGEQLTLHITPLDDVGDPTYGLVLLVVVEKGGPMEVSCHFTAPYTSSHHESLRQVQNLRRFVPDEDPRGRNVVHCNYCTCLAT